MNFDVYFELQLIFITFAVQTIIINSFVYIETDKLLTLKN